MSSVTLTAELLWLVVLVFVLISGWHFTHCTWVYCPITKEFRMTLERRSGFEISHLRRKCPRIPGSFPVSPLLLFTAFSLPCPKFNHEAVFLCGFAILIFSEASGLEWNPNIKEPRPSRRGDGTFWGLGVGFFCLLGFLFVFWFKISHSLLLFLCIM